MKVEALAPASSAHLASTSAITETHNEPNLTILPNSADLVLVSPNQVTAESLEHLFREAQHRWLKGYEIYCILRNFQQFGYQCCSKPPLQPKSGSLFLFDKRKVRFRKDGINWKKKKDGKTVREHHEKLKVSGVKVLNCCYAHCEDNEGFHRRAYSILNRDDSTVLVHYLDDRMRSRKACSPVSHQQADARPSDASSHSPSPASSPLSTPASPKAVQSAQEDSLSPTEGKEIDSGVEELKAKSIDGSLSGMLATPLFTDSILEDFVHIASDNPSLSSNPGQLATLSNSSQQGTPGTPQIAVQSPAQPPTPSFERSKRSAFKFSQSSAFQQQENSMDISSLEEVDENDFDPFKAQNFLTASVDGDSNRSVSSLLIQSVENLRSRKSSKEASQEHATEQGSSSRSMPSPVSQITINDYAPDWGYSEGGSKVLVAGPFPPGHSYYVMFDQNEVPAELFQAGILRCKVPPHPPGLVLFYVTIGKRKRCSEVKQFEYRDRGRPLLSRSKPPSLSEERDFRLRMVERLEKLEATVSSRGNGHLQVPASIPTLPSRINDFTTTNAIESSGREEDLLVQIIGNILKSGDYERGITGRDQSGATLLHHVAALGYAKATTIIAQATPILLEATDNTGKTPLYWATQNGHKNVMSALLAAGASALQQPVPSTSSSSSLTSSPASIPTSSGSQVSGNGLPLLFRFLTNANTPKLNASGKMSAPPTPSYSAPSTPSVSDFLLSQSPRKSQLEAPSRRDSLETLTSVSRFHSPSTPSTTSDSKRKSAALAIQKAYRKYRTVKKKHKNAPAQLLALLNGSG